jgi:hypothetical protein
MGSRRAIREAGGGVLGYPQEAIRMSNTRKIEAVNALRIRVEEWTEGFPTEIHRRTPRDYFSCFDKTDSEDILGIIDMITLLIQWRESVVREEMLASVRAALTDSLDALVPKPPPS